MTIHIRMIVYHLHHQTWIVVTMQSQIISKLKEMTHMVLTAMEMAKVVNQILQAGVMTTTMTKTPMMENRTSRIKVIMKMNMTTKKTERMLVLVEIVMIRMNASQMAAGVRRIFQSVERRANIIQNKSKIQLILRET